MFKVHYADIFDLEPNIIDIILFGM